MLAVKIEYLGIAFLAPSSA
jgi:hypothetical protein